MPALPGLGAVMAGFAASFTPVTYDLDSGSTSLTIPSGATAYEAWAIGGGGGAGWAGGGTNPNQYGGGGGGGGGAYLSGSVLPGEWGASITRSVGAAGTNETAQTASNATAGGASTLSATLGGVSVSLTANGGGATQGAAGGAGGTASGGSTNTTGFQGGDIDDADLDGTIDTNGIGGDPAGIFAAVAAGRGRGGNGKNLAAPTGGRIRVKFT